jgi:beta-mannanase
VFIGDSTVLGSWKGVFIGDGDCFRQDFGQYHVPSIVYWESGLTAQQVQNGVADSYVKNWTTKMAAYGQPIIFAPLDDMNGNWNSYSGDPNA